MFLSLEVVLPLRKYFLCGGDFGEFTVAFVLDERFRIGEESPVDVHGGEFAFGFGVAEVGDQTAVGASSGRNDGFQALGAANEGVGDVDAHCGGLDITFDSGQLPRDE